MVDKMVFHLSSRSVKVCNVILILMGFPSFCIAADTQELFLKLVDSRLANAYRQPQVQSATECGAECLDDEQCMSVNYFASGNTCELNQNHGTDLAATLLYASGWTVLNLMSGTSKDGWFVYGIFEYKFETTNKGWEEARLNCQTMSSDLVAVKSDGLQQFIVSKIASQLNARWWLGGSDQALEGDWRWSDGAEVEFDAWHPIQPNNAGGNQHCMLMFYLADTAQFYWDDSSCDAQKYSICERRL